jgi:ribosomal-protein-alanine N-acetyltransferase
MIEPIEIATEHFLLRTLSENDATERYLGWLDDNEARKFIVTAATIEKLADLRGYIRERVGREEIVFLGIFNKCNGLHIGNIKYEPVDSAAGYAIMGVLIGDPDYRGKGVTVEVLVASVNWLRQHRQIKQILLGVDKENKAAIRAYEKVGFVIADTPHIQRVGPGIETMIWRL